MYDEMVKSLRICGDSVDAIDECCYEDCIFHERPINPLCMQVLCNKAADAIEELSMRLHGDEAAIAGMKREIERMVRAEKPRWIPVTERLPEKYTAVLAAGNGEVACGLFIGFAEPAHVASWDLDNVAAEPVTHWMPLPEPPKEETE